MVPGDDQTGTPETDPHRPLRADVRLLGGILGETLRRREGQDLFDAVEEVRAFSKATRLGEAGAFGRLTAALGALSIDRARTVARAFSLFLSLANIAEQHHRVRRRRVYQRRSGTGPQRGSCDAAFAELINEGVTPDALYEAVRDLEVELVLTAHPTEVTRRTMLQKFNRIAEALARRDREDLTRHERAEVERAIRREVEAAWGSDDVRHDRPTPLDEARWGFVVIEQSLWDVVPDYLRLLDGALERHTGRRLPLDAAPVRFGSWMGGDRDGNPSVTPDVTRRVCLLSRWMAADLFHREVAALRAEVSMTDTTDELWTRVGRDAREPYRALLREVRDRLAATRAAIEARLAGREPDDAPVYRETAELAEPLTLCHRALVESGYEEVARGRLLDVLRRLACFGLALLRLDLRQEASRHTEAIDAITRRLGLGSYAEWPEDRRVEFLRRELAGTRPLIPRDLAAGEAVTDVLETFRMAAEQPPGSLGAYVISMAGAASDVLAVALLQREFAVEPRLRIVPLFETVRDLQDAGACLERLLAVPEYRAAFGDRQEVMIGYSDSAKDGGRIAAAWELYAAQERIVETCRRHGVEVTLFHGRGGSIGRGGGPTYHAIQSQPPGSIQGRLRVTEQGEMIQAKFGLPGVASRTLELYTTATLRAGLAAADPPPAEWRDLMTTLADESREAFRLTVHEDPRFVPYFHAATPVGELDLLNIGSRPARRAAGSSTDGGAAPGVGALRAIPFVFAWTQMRLMLPSWLGVGEALVAALDRGAGPRLRQMYAGWPFFRSTLDLIEMVLAKAEPSIAAHYQARLVPEALRPLGDELIGRLASARAAILDVTGHASLLADNAVLRRSIDVRNPYVDPINLMQVELLRRRRAGTGGEATLQALIVTINGIAAGMRNTG